MKSIPFTSLRAGANELPTVFWMAAASMRVIVAGASVIFSARRDAETTTPPSERGTVASETLRGVSPPLVTTTAFTI